MGTLTGASADAGVDAGVRRLRDTAGRAADVLVENAISGGGRTTWLGATVDWVDGDPGVVHRTGDASLYDGSAGVALAGWSVAQALGRNDLAEAAVGAARHALSARGRLTGAGLFDGSAGVGLAALEVGTEAGDSGLTRGGLDLLDAVAEVGPSGPDLVSGSAGVVLALLAAARRTGSDRWLRATVVHGEHLLAAAARYPWGWAWPLDDAPGPPLCGLAHGAAGVAWALGALAAATDDSRFAAAVDHARRYERSWFEPATNSWPDLRSDGAVPGPAPRPALWCHGSVGIGLARLALYRAGPEPWLAAEAAAALLSSTAHASAGLAGDLDGGLTVCHGLGGTLLLLLSAHRSLGEAEHLGAARLIAHRALDRMGPDPAAWPSGVRGGGFSPGLMTGLAGSMYALTEVAEPTGAGLLAPILG